MPDKKLRTAVIGTGYLGKFHAEKYANLPNSDLVAVVDANAENGQAIADKFGCDYYDNHMSLVGKVDAVSIAAPTTLHHSIAKDLLENDIHVLVEKPITVTLDEADELIQLAEKHQKVLQVGHLERFNAAVLEADTVVKAPRFIEAHRLAPFKPRATDVNVVLDLMIHDIDIILNLVKSEVSDIAASGTSILSNSTDICNVRLTFDNGCVANVTASRISMKTERKMRIFQERSCVTVDFQDRQLGHFYTGEGEMFPGVPAIESDTKQFEDGDALKAEIAAFLDCIIHQKRPLVSGEDGRRALDIAQRITQAING